MERPRALIVPVDRERLAGQAHRCGDVARGESIAPACEHLAQLRLALASRLCELSLPLELGSAGVQLLEDLVHRRMGRRELRQGVEGAGNLAGDEQTTSLGDRRLRLTIVFGAPTRLFPVGEQALPHREGRGMRRVERQRFVQRGKRPVDVLGLARVVDCCLNRLASRSICNLLALPLDGGRCRAQLLMRL